MVAALAGGGIVLALMPFVPLLGALAGLAVVFAAATATVSAMVFGMVATEVPADRRSTTLNLVYLPLYAAGILGPALGAVVVIAGGIPAPFVLGGAVFIIGSIVIATRSTGTPATRVDATTRSRKGCADDRPPDDPSAHDASKLQASIRSSVARG